MGNQKIQKPKTNMEHKLIACCGLDCETCEARIATIKNDDELRRQTAEKWREMNGTDAITTETINCMGCRTEGVKFAYCEGMCQIRKCVREKGFETCGDCSRIETCEQIGMILKNLPEAKANLQSLKY